MSKNKFSIEGDKTLMNGTPFIAKGFRCSSALYSDRVVDGLIENLPVYKEHGINSFSIFLMGNRFTDIAGYREDGTIDPVYKARMRRILDAADDMGLLTVVGCLYWGESKAKWKSWTIKDACKAVQNTLSFLADNDYRHTFVDVDNEGMASREAGFSTYDLIEAAHSVDSTIPVSHNNFGDVPENADLCVHFSNHVKGKPYIDTEGTPWNAPGGYWDSWSRKMDGVKTYGKDTSYWNYVRVGRYTDDMKRYQIDTAKEHFDRGDGYFLASTWFQAAPPLGPHHKIGGNGGESDPGIGWYLNWLKESGY